MRHLATLILTTLLLLLCSCDDDARGLMISGDGAVMFNTPERERAKVTTHIAKELTAQLGEHWVATVAIAELPEYDDDQNRGFADNWYWNKATVAVALVGDGQKEQPQTNQSIDDAVRDYLRRRVDRPKRNLAVAVTSQVDAARYAALTRTAAAAPPAAAPGAGAGQRPAGSHTYTVQTGDTLAIISSVFYGSADQWRLISQANPGLDAAHLVPGTVITIPPAPAP
jgi:hypothetical protein